MEEHFGSLNDPHFWVLMATVAFALIAYKKGRAPILSFLDARTVRIKNDLDEAERLKNEAQELLAECQRKHRDAIQTSQKIIDAAKETATRLQSEAEQKLSDSIKRKEAQLLDRIARAEASAVQELRHQAADLAAKSAELLLHDAMGKRGAKLVDEAIGDLPSKLN